MGGRASPTERQVTHGGNPRRNSTGIAAPMENHLARNDRKYIPLSTFHFLLALIFPLFFCRLPSFGHHSRAGGMNLFSCHVPRARWSSVRPSGLLNRSACHHRIVCHPPYACSSPYLTSADPLEYSPDTGFRSPGTGHVDPPIYVIPTLKNGR